MIGDVGGKEGIVGCGVCKREEPRQANGHIPAAWTVESKPIMWPELYDDRPWGYTYWFDCHDHLVTKEKHGPMS